MAASEPSAVRYAARRVVRHVRREQELQGSGATLVLSGYLAAMEQLVRHINHFTPPPA